MKYIGFDGVILDVEDFILSEWKRMFNGIEMPKNVKIDYMKKLNWGYILWSAPIVNDSVYILKDMDCRSSAIVTKIYSMEDDGLEKVKYLKENGIKQDIILVPYFFGNSSLIRPEGNILVDANMDNLYEWNFYGGEAMFLDKNGDNIGNHGIFNKDGYRRVRRIDE